MLPSLSPGQVTPTIFKIISGNGFMKTFTVSLSLQPTVFVEVIMYEVALSGATFSVGKVPN